MTIAMEPFVTLDGTILMHQQLAGVLTSIMVIGNDRAYGMMQTV